MKSPAVILSCSKRLCTRAACMDAETTLFCLPCGSEAAHPGRATRCLEWMGTVAKSLMHSSDRRKHQGDAALAEWVSSCQKARSRLMPAAQHALIDADKWMLLCTLCHCCSHSTTACPSLAPPEGRTPCCLRLPAVPCWHCSWSKAPPPRGRLQSPPFRLSPLEGSQRCRRGWAGWQEAWCPGLSRSGIAVVSSGVSSGTAEPPAPLPRQP